MAIPHEELLSQAIPGATILNDHPKTWGKLSERPWRFWRDAGSQWAVYLLVGPRLSEVTIKSIQEAQKLGLKPVIIAADGNALKAAAPHYVGLKTHIACDVGGRPHLIPPCPPLPRRRNRPAISATRVPTDLLNELSTSLALPIPLRRRLRALHLEYQNLAALGGKGNNDDAECALLTNYAQAYLVRLGFTTTKCDVPQLVRRLEKAGWGGSRDHFFHSFQNYFFGLLAISKLCEFFNGCRERANLQFMVSPYDVWFFSALWHDIGYGIEKMGHVQDEILGVQLEEEPGESARTDYLRTPIVAEAVRIISCLTARLLLNAPPRIPWSLPIGAWRRTTVEKKIAEALAENVLEASHGAAGALRLYVEFMPAIRRMVAAKQSTLQPTLIMACCSMPFHDHHFRACMRKCVGHCMIPTTAMPFASLLAFIDSIQDDRRDLAGVKAEVGFLERLLTEPPATIRAEVNHTAIAEESVLWKTVEARDVISSFNQQRDKLFFEYPQWMVA